MTEQSPSKIRAAFRIRVLARLRPSSSSSEESPVTFRAPNQIVLGSRAFVFDDVLWSTQTPPEGVPYASQDRVFDATAAPLLDHALKGFNTCVFAYGQTGSGKSHTMIGTQHEPGIIPRVGHELFARISRGPPCGVTVSFYEIYNHDKIRDLLVKNNTNNHIPSLKVRENSKTGPYVEGLTSLAISSPGELYSVLEQGSRNRTVAATALNDASSRSHAIFCISLTQAGRVSRMHLVDLAGSERAKTSGTSGARLREGSEINKSLSSLARVISALVEKQRRPATIVPYRDSMLTWVLKEALGGNSMTAMVATLSPDPTNADHTLSTLRFATSVKKIENVATINESREAASGKLLVRALRDEIEKLKGQLAQQENVSELKEKLEAAQRQLAEQSTLASPVRDLESLGLVPNSRLFDLPRLKLPYIMNVTEGRSSFFTFTLQRGTTTAGSSAEANIKVHGDRILAVHCKFISDKDTTLVPMENALVTVNGVAVTTPTLLTNNCRIALGPQGSLVVRFFDPLRRGGSLPRAKEPKKNAPDDEAISMLDDDAFEGLYHRVIRSRHLRTSSASSSRPDLDHSFVSEDSVTISGDADLNPREKQLASKYAAVWRQRGDARFVREFLSHLELIGRAQMTAREFGLPARQFQLMVVDSTGLQHSPYDEDPSTGKSSFIVGPGEGPRLAVRFQNSATLAVQICSLKAVRRMVPHGVNVGVVRRAAPEHYMEMMVPEMTGCARLRFTYLGKAEVIVGEEVETDVVSPYTYSVVGRIRLNKVGQHGYTLFLGGMSHEEIQDVHCGVSVVARNEHGVVVSVKRIAATPIMESFRGADDEEEEKRNGDGYIRFPSYFEVPEEATVLLVEVYGTVKNGFLEKLTSWDALQEEAPVNYIPQPPPERFRVRVKTQVVELDEDGRFNAPVPVAGSHVMELRQGVVRRLRIEIEIPLDASAATKEEEPRYVSVAIGKPVLTDLYGSEVEEAEYLGQDKVEEVGETEEGGEIHPGKTAKKKKWAVLKAAGKPKRRMELDRNVEVVSVECHWDRHDDLLIRATRANSLVRVPLEVRLATEGEGLVLEYGVNVRVRPRGSGSAYYGGRRSSWRASSIVWGLLFLSSGGGEEEQQDDSVKNEFRIVCGWAGVPRTFAEYRWQVWEEEAREDGGSGLPSDTIPETKDLFAEEGDERPLEWERRQQQEPVFLRGVSVVSEYWMFCERSGKIDQSRSVGRTKSVRARWQRLLHSAHRGERSCDDGGGDRVPVMISWMV